MRYRMRRLFSTSLGAIGEHYRIEDEDGTSRFSVDNKIITYWPTLTMRDANGNAILSIQRRGFTPQAPCRIFDDGHYRATVRQHWVGGHMQFTAEFPDAANIEILGDWHEQAFAFKRGDQDIARDVGPWFSMNATYDITIAPGQDDALILACAVIIHWANEPAQAR